MSRLTNKQSFRVIDANYNRAKEGIRVAEDICRFILDDSKFTREYKKCRHDLSQLVTQLGYDQIIEARNIEKDVGKSSTHSELKRQEWKDIYFANTQRVKESVRVLEEFSKLLNKEIAQDLKKLRYRFYAIEKKTAQKI